MAQKGSATEAAMAALHLKLTEKFSDILDAEEIASSDLNAIRAFLKDNDIRCDPEQPGAVAEVAEKTADVLQFPYDPAEEA